MYEVNFDFIAIEVLVVFTNNVTFHFGQSPRNFNSSWASSDHNHIHQAFTSIGIRVEPAVFAKTSAVP